MVILSSARRSLLVAVAAAGLILAVGFAAQAAPPLAATPSASPNASPGASPVAVESTAVHIKGFLFKPDTVEITKGGSITWVNDDIVQHTATGLDREVLQTGAIKQGQSKTVNFNDAGTIEYFCEFHSGMKGTIVVK